MSSRYNATINLANEKNQETQSPSPEAEEQTQDSPPSENNPLGGVRDRLRVETKRYTAGGIVQGVNEILQGDFSGIEEELEITLDAVTEGKQPKVFRLGNTSFILFSFRFKSSQLGGCSQRPLFPDFSMGVGA